MRRLGWLAPLFLGGCSLILGIEDLPGGGGDGGFGDGGLDAMPPPPAVLSVGVERFDMGAALVGAPIGVPGTVTITNAGTTRTGKLTPSFSSAAFSATGSCTDAELDPGASCVVEIGFTPEAAGIVDDVLTVSAYGGGSIETKVSGEGLSAGTLLGDVTLMDFGSVGAQIAGAPLDLLVTNDGATEKSGAITVRVTGQDARSFAVSRSECAEYSLAPVGACQVRVRPLLRAAGRGRAVLALTSPMGGSIVVPLVASSYPTTGLTVTQGNIAFSSTSVGGTSPVVSFTVTNAGDTATGPMTVEWGGAPFAVSSNGCAAGILPTTSCTIEVRVEAQAPGQFSSNLRIQGENGSGWMLGGSVTVPVPATLDVDRPTLTFMNAQAGPSPSAEGRVRIFNRGEESMPTPTISVPGGSPFTVDYSSPCPSIPAGGGCWVRVIFKPVTGVTSSVLLTVTNGTETKTVTLNGTGVDDSEIFFTAAGFPTASVGSPQTDTVTLTNNSIGSTTLSAPVTFGPFSVQAGGSCSTGGTIGVGGSCTATIRFLPTTPGPHVGLIIQPGSGGVSMLPLFGLATGSLSVNTTGTGSWIVFPPPEGGNAVCSGPGSCSRVLVSSSFTASYVPQPATLPAQTWGTGAGPICDGYGRTPCPLTFDGLTGVQANFVATSLTATVTGAGGFLESPENGILCPPLCTSTLRSTNAVRIVARTVDTMITSLSCPSASSSGSCTGAASAITPSLAVTPAWSLLHAGAENLADEALSVTTRANVIYATGYESKVANGAELLFLDVTALGVKTQAIANNYLGDDRGQDIVSRGPANTLVVAGEQGFGSPTPLPALVSFTIGPPSVPTSLGQGTGSSRGLSRLAATPAANTLFALSTSTGSDTVLRHWDAANAVEVGTDPRQWTAIAAHPSTDHALLAGTYMGNLVLGKLAANTTFAWSETRTGLVDPVAVEIATFSGGNLLVVLNETVAGRGTNVRLIERNDVGTTDIATTAFDSGPDSNDVAIAALVDSLGQVVVLGKTGEQHWIRRYSRELRPLAPIFLSGSGLVLRDLTIDGMGNFVVVGSEDAGGQRDALVRKIGP